jgi:beta-glucosidase
VMACAKHFAAYGAAEAGLDYNGVDVSERTLRETYFPPFEAALAAGAGSVMAAFNELSGIPATGNHWLLTDVLRDQWRFDGLVVSDYTADEEMIAHGFAADARDATKLAFLAGVDMSMQSGFYRDHLPSLVASGEVPLSRLDQAVGRVLMMKERLGLFDDPFRRIDRRREKSVVLTTASRALARSAAVKSIVMLKNDGDLLPLRRSGQRIALIGPFAEGQHDLVGPWVVYGEDAQAVDLAWGVRAAVESPSLVSTSAGCAVEQPIPGAIEAAVSLANKADVVVLAVGEAQTMSGESQSRAEIIIPPAQQALAEAIAATGKPMVVVVKNGRALALEGAVRDAAAILVTWFLGTESGHAIADILFGAASPSARLPVSFPMQSGQEPYHYDHKVTGRPNPPGLIEPLKAHFRGIPHEALYAFGHGLTYGHFIYSDLELDGGRLSWNGTLTVAATIRNEGARSAEELVQLYVRKRVASVTRPVRQLKAFAPVLVAPGASRKVTFALRREQLSFVGQYLKELAEPGVFDLWIAPSAQADGVSGQFVLEGPST